MMNVAQVWGPGRRAHLQAALPSVWQVKEITKFLEYGFCIYNYLPIRCM